ncbi:flagellar basal-body MS-ring/collar protein FliF [Herbaspirillum sp. YR522]|uniref:flagellar basal-body MS-ring/collar protein FliF n=1 Tax=Herbaspirillum sp. YR522 TaxID=1144342 RepID=UPI00026F64EE|nr:flagellar basal-body MS-ring/collar protein FliF [Herbaspirillum sp. YR522]EJN08287.1 flagellar basal-body M-ring protein/flagellar hook-basal body protein FliF [Herbaspirillum sp. YR522]
MAVAADGTMTSDSNNQGVPGDGTAPPSPPPGVMGYARSPQGRRILLIIAAAATVALMIGIWMWSQKIEYRVLFSNFNDRDGGAIVASLQTMNVPYKYSDGGSAILVPENMVHDARLKLAAQGLPKGGNVGFEVMENQKLGVSQFLEQVNFQRALEGELARSVQSLSSVQSARVHLALPKASVFVRDQQKPTASVVLSLYPGRFLDGQQVSAIVHLVASSVPELSPKAVTIVDQNGNLLSDTTKQAQTNTLDPTQLKYVQDMQQDIVKRVESIIAPIVGNGNVRAEATADIDFSRTEQASEAYKPNQTQDTAAVRSKQSSEASNSSSGTSGIPGALSNQPPAPATAPIVNPAAANAQGQAGAAAPAAPTASSQGNSRKDETVNYEVDKTVRYTQQPIGGVRRLTVAVVVNYKRTLDNTGKIVMRPLTEAERNQITDLVREAMGFNKDRGDSLNVVNTQFNTDLEPEVPLWKQPGMIELAKEIGKYVLLAAVLLYLYFGVLRPIIWKLSGREERERLAKEKAEAEAEAAAAAAAAGFDPDDPDAIVNLSGEPAIDERAQYKANLETAKQWAKNDPKLVASIIKTWVNNE